MQFEGRSCSLIDLLTRAIDRANLPQGVIAWRAAGYRLFKYPADGQPPLKGDHPDLHLVDGRLFDHRAFVSASMANPTFASGLGHYEVLYKLLVEPGVNVLAVLDTWDSEQRELLIQAGVLYRIEKVEMAQDCWFVQARVLAGQPPPPAS